MQSFPMAGLQRLRRVISTKMTDHNQGGQANLRPDIAGRRVRSLARRTIRSYGPTFLLIFFVMIPWLSVPLTAQANATPSFMLPESGGLVVPTTTSAVRIDRERLSFDLTGDLNQALVKASYDLANVSGKDVSLDLTFIASQSGALVVSLDGTPLVVRESPTDGLPKEWVAITSGIDPLTGQDYDLGGPLDSREGSRAFSFRLQLPAGKSGTLDARYTARLGFDRDRYSYNVHHLAYVLGPAKNWAGFGTLDVSVIVPSRYVLASSPSLNKISNSNGAARYGGTFQGIPGELLRLSTVASAASASSDWETGKTVLAFVIPLAVALIMCLVYGYLFSRLKRPWLAVFCAIFLAPLATLAVSWLVFTVPPDNLILPAILSGDPDLGSSTTYASFFLIFVWALWMLAVLVMASIIAGVYAGRGSSRRARGAY
ncbi:MAG: hypothetical protein Q7O66_05055 [Dehalococcoidia bacterium]|nr:hypothetical protein [Dehalococcoidia bacterium]